VTRVPLTDQDAGSAGLLDLLASDSRPDEPASLVGTRWMPLRSADEYEIRGDRCARDPAGDETVLLARNPGVQMLIVATIGGARVATSSAPVRGSHSPDRTDRLVVCGADSE